MKGTLEQRLNRQFTVTAWKGLYYKFDSNNCGGKLANMFL